MSLPAHAVHYTWEEYLGLESASNVNPLPDFFFMQIGGGGSF